MPAGLNRSTWVALLSGCFIVTSALLVGVAFRLSADDPELYYSSDRTAGSRDIRVLCLDEVSDGKGDLEHVPLLAAGDDIRLRYRAIQGEDALARIQQKTGAFAVQRGINADCSDARAGRLGMAVRLLGAAVVAVLAALVVPLVTRRRRQGPLEH